MAASDSEELYKELINELSAIIRNKKNTSESLSVLKKISPCVWRSTWNAIGNTLLQTSIIHKNKEAFHFLLPFYDIVSLERQNSQNETALSLALKNCKPDTQSGDYFALELIKSGAFIHTYLDLALMSTSKVVALLIEKGVDVNVQNDEGNTALHTILMCNDKKVNIDEIVAVLMYYNADPHIENNKGYIPFEYAMRDDHEVPLQEILFLYTFDKYTNCKINMETVIHMAKSNSPLFYEMFKYNITFKQNIIFEHHLKYKPPQPSRINKRRTNRFFIPFIEPCTDFDFFNSLLNIDSDKLEVITRNCNSALKKIISLTKFPVLDKLAYEPLTSKKGVDNLNILLESGAKPKIISLLTTLKSNEVFESAILNNSEEVATEVLTYLLSYGLHFEESEYHTVYRSFGYCNLFKLLLHVGGTVPCRWIGSIIPRVIYDIRLDHERIFETGTVCKNSIELLDYFAHPKLADYLLNCKDGEVFSEEIVARIERHPKIPRLEELGRNVFRKYLIKRFRIHSISLFYSYVNWLPISNTHKKIITYEAKLYQ